MKQIDLIADIEMMQTLEESVEHLATACKESPELLSSMLYLSFTLICRESGLTRERFDKYAEHLHNHYRTYFEE